MKIAIPSEAISLTIDYNGFIIVQCKEYIKSNPVFASPRINNWVIGATRPRKSKKYIVLLCEVSQIQRFINGKHQIVDQEGRDYKEVFLDFRVF